MPESLFGVLLGWLIQRFKDQNWPGYINLVIAGVASSMVGLLLWLVQGDTTAEALLRKLALVFGGSQGYFLLVKALGLSNNPIFGQPKKK